MFSPAETIKSNILQVVHLKKKDLMQVIASHVLRELTV